MPEESGYFFCVLLKGEAVKQEVQATTQELESSNEDGSALASNARNAAFADA